VKWLVCLGTPRIHAKLGHELLLVSYLLSSCNEVANIGPEFSILVVKNGSVVILLCLVGLVA
jgi:hypothetical protein